MRLAKIIETRHIYLEIPLEQGGLRLLNNADYVFADGVVEGSSLNFAAKRLLEYRQDLGGQDSSGALAPYNNYIYRIGKPLRIFMCSKEDILFVLRRGMVDLKGLQKAFPDSAPEEALLAIQAKPNALFGDTGLLRFFLKKPFMAYFDGLLLEPKLSYYWGCVGLWLDLIKVGAELVDGNAMRFVKESPLASIPTIPKDIMADLVKYCATAGGNISTESRKWFRENLKAPSSVKVYRGIFLNGSTVQELSSTVQKYTGLSGVTEAHRGAEVKLSRGKASSWSKTPQISRGFSSFGPIQLLLQTELTPKQVIVDLTLIPLEARQKLFNFSQNEVIAMPGKISAKIVGINISKGILEAMASGKPDPEWLKYAWVPQYGIVLKSKAVIARVLARYLGWQDQPLPFEIGSEP